MMNLILHRTDLRQDCTLGVLTIEGTQFSCATLEPSSLSQTLPEMGRASKGSIPRGKYKVNWQWSNHFGKNMPFIENVPGFTGIMIHPGNTARDTKGCILVGQNPPRQGATGKILNSRLTFTQFEALLKEATESIWITIE